MMLNILGAFIGALILAEGIAQAAGMDGGDKVCRMGKYVLAVLLGFALTAYGVGGVVSTLLPQFVPSIRLDWFHVLSGGAILLFVWPDAYIRFRDFNILNRRGSRLGEGYRKGKA